MQQILRSSASVSNVSVISRHFPIKKESSRLLRIKKFSARAFHMTDEEESLYGLYDRQIRLFGRDTQGLIEDAYAYITQGSPYVMNRKMRDTDIGGEILKNLVLLGVKRAFVNEATRSSFNRISPNDISGINPEIEIKDVGSRGEKSTRKMYTVAIHIDQKDEVKAHTEIYVCSRCMSFHDIKKEHVCRGYVLGDAPLADDCLLGAIVVQEWIKKLQNKPYVEEYKLQL